ncbi:putative glycosyl transferase [Paenibacillus sp. FSL R7-277]|uniref:glycosyltransferase n=1 Tax=Paenibacillus sp. FSL R7-277 TaxID=1227352 RepID=UPI0003E28B50|nr:glycosyltransferase [Paenibacillus sp. FSL R7-277]ETT72283.1 putative glycosyl transferase [Paenibacillus sp. FSL R7-277]
MLNISEAADEKGHDSYVSFAKSRTSNKKVIKNGVSIGSIVERNVHLKLAYYTGLNGSFSIFSTKRFLRKIDIIKPDIIHLHNLHNCYINLKLLFDYIKKKRIQVVWTLHDCWAFTGQCTHFTLTNCEKWKNQCYECPQYKEYPASRIDMTRKMYSLKKEWFNGVENLTLVTPSQWLADKVKQSFLRGYPVKIINNGIDLNIFKPIKSDFRSKYNLSKKKIILGVANPWSKGKGLDIFVELAKKVDKSYKIVLVGLSSEQLKSIPSNILGLPKTNNTQELVGIYSSADYFVNPSIEETMGLVTVESIACGTPAIVSNFTAVPEMLNSESGIVIDKYDADTFYKAIKSNNKFKQENLLKWAENFELKRKYKDYILLYESIIK